MRVYAILAHPKKESLSGRLFFSVVEHLQNQGVTVDVLDLYEHVDRVPFYVSSKQVSENAFFQENKERFMAADRLFIVYPIYFYAVPGILKCWFDLISNFAWKYEKGHYAKPLHKIKKALVINNASMDQWFRWLFTRNSATEMVKQSFKFIGINDYAFYEIGNAEKLSVQQTNRHIENIKRKSDWLIF